MPPAHWIALRWRPRHAEQTGGNLQPSTPEHDDADTPTGRLSLWAQQFSPRVTWWEEVLLLEVQASLRLFGGAAALHERMRHEAAALGLHLEPADLAWGPTALSAIGALRAGLGHTAQQGRSGVLSQPLARWADRLPLHTLSAARPHLDALQQMGCRRWGDLRHLPRPGLVRRFGESLLLALDQAYGDQPHPLPWLPAPERFFLRTEWTSRVDDSLGLLARMDALWPALMAWLSARQWGALKLRLRWYHDTLRAREVPASQHLDWALARPCRDRDHLERVLKEQLARHTLQAPALGLSLEVLEAHPLEAIGTDLWGQPDDEDLAWEQALERIQARLGSGRVREASLQGSLQPERMQAWRPWQPAQRPRAKGQVRPAGLRLVSEIVQAPAGIAEDAAAPTGLPEASGPIARPGEEAPRKPGGEGLPPLTRPAYAALHPAPAAQCDQAWDGMGRPTWLLPQPQKLAMRDGQPWHHGPVRLLLGPERLEGAWWSSAPATHPEHQAAALQREYWVAHSPAGLMWVFQEAGDPAQSEASRPWHLHGWFA
jgi:protein ImuB